MACTYVPLIAVLTPLAASPVAYIAGRRGEEQAGCVAVAACTASLSMLILSALHAPAVSRLGYVPLLGHLVLLVDGISAVVAPTVAFLSLLSAVYSLLYMGGMEKPGEYYALYSLFVAGMLGSVLAVNLALFLLFFELMLIPSWALIAVWGSKGGKAAAFKYFMYTEGGALIMLTGVGALYMSSKTLFIPEISYGVAPGAEGLAALGVALIVVGLMVKMAIVPFHGWLPDAYAEAPVPVSAVMSSAMTGIGGYMIVRMLYQAYPALLDKPVFSNALMMLALVTIVYGGIAALEQNDLNRLLAYSSISQMGYILFGIASTSVLGAVGALLLYISHGFAKALLFMASGVLEKTWGTRDISKLRGLAGLMPTTAVLVMVGFLALAGIPPLLGFWSELYVFGGAIILAVSTANMARLALAIAALAATVITAAYGLWAYKKVFYGEPPESAASISEPWGLLMPMVLLAALLAVFGVIPGPLLSLLAKALGS